MMLHYLVCSLGSETEAEGPRARECEKPRSQILGSNNLFAYALTSLELEETESYVLMNQIIP